MSRFQLENIPNSFPNRMEAWTDHLSRLETAIETKGTRKGTALQPDVRPLNAANHAMNRRTGAEVIIVESAEPTSASNRLSPDATRSSWMLLLVDPVRRQGTTARMTAPNRQERDRPMPFHPT